MKRHVLEKRQLNGRLKRHGDGNYVALALVVLTLDYAGQRIDAMTSFVKPELFDAIGRPRELPPRS